MVLYLKIIEILSPYDAVNRTCKVLAGFCSLQNFPLHKPAKLVQVFTLTTGEKYQFRQTLFKCYIRN